VWGYGLRIVSFRRNSVGHAVDAVIDSGDCGTEPTTVVDWTEGHLEVVRVGAGDPGRFG